MKWFWNATWSIAWALWLGGVAAIMILVQRLFHFDRTVALAAAPQMFLVFEKYEVVLAIIAAVTLLVGEHRKRIAPVALTAFGVLNAIVSAFVITPRIEFLRKAGLTDSTRFRALHGTSMTLYLVQMICLLLIGVLLSRPSRTAV